MRLPYAGVLAFLISSVLASKSGSKAKAASKPLSKLPDAPQVLQHFYTSHKKPCKRNLATHLLPAKAGGVRDLSFCGDAIDEGIKAVYISSSSNPYHYSRFAVDCDGSNMYGIGCGSDQTGQAKTAFKDILKVNKLKDLDATIHSYVVFGNDAFKIRPHNIKPLSLVAILCGGKLAYAVLGDISGDTVGEGSLALVRLCFPGDGISGSNGHEVNDVLVMAFQGSESMVGQRINWDATTAEEFQASLHPIGNKMLENFLGTVDAPDSQTEPVTPKENIQPQPKIPSNDISRSQRKSVDLKDMEYTPQASQGQDVPTGTNHLQNAAYYPPDSTVQPFQGEMDGLQNMINNPQSQPLPLQNNRLQDVAFRPEQNQVQPLPVDPDGVQNVPHENKLPPPQNRAQNVANTPQNDPPNQLPSSQIRPTRHPAQHKVNRVQKVAAKVSSPPKRVLPGRTRLASGQRKTIPVASQGRRTHRKPVVRQTPNNPVRISQNPPSVPKRVVVKENPQIAKKPKRIVNLAAKNSLSEKGIDTGFLKGLIHEASGLQEDARLPTRFNA
ncbi:MAG: hypothetical protein M1829_001767 [Trizodia sp. TS-e1964]|nr:MAG: hypothetical protein M1829_001767 [Trizodia sp. TS-e1964]